jgi:hypothetical protein
MEREIEFISCRNYRELRPVHGNDKSKITISQLAAKKSIDKPSGNIDGWL